jgi:gliding motility-associated-like protein
MLMNVINLLMSAIFKKAVTLFLCLASLFSSAQNEKKKWYFGQQAGLDFASNPPTVLTNGAMWQLEGCSSIADQTGNLLFYTDGITVWDQSHSTMSNGFFLNGASSSSQSALIVKQPSSSSLYYIFTQDAQAGTDGFCYSIVNMSLSAGMGSVTVKNAQLVTPSTEKISAVRHCNGSDIWVVTHDWNSNNFRSYLLTSAGLNTVAVLSGVGQTHTTINQVMGMQGCMKISPNSKKLAVAISTYSMLGNGFNSTPTTELFDFDNSTGIVSNPVTLGFYDGAYGVEFSPDGSKLYICKWSNGNEIFQYDLCASTATAIAASQFTVASSLWLKGSMQLAPNGKIYVARYNQQDLGVINNPNGLGLACNYAEMGQSISPKLNNMGLPNNVVSYKQQPPGLTYTVSCLTGSFGYPLSLGSTVGCSNASYSLLALSWNFGDPGTGTNNTSTLQNPVHAFSGIGTYTVKLILNYSCGGGNDTLSQVVNINQVCLTVNASSFSCSGLGSATITPSFGIGPYVVSWLPGLQTGSVATGLTPGTKTVIVNDLGGNSSYTTTVTFTPQIPFTGSLSPAGNVVCFGGNTGSVSVVNLSGGSGSQNYLWTNGFVTYTVPTPLNLSAGSWTSTVTDALTGCVINNTFVITQPPALTLTIAASSPTACTGNTIILTGSNSGGVAGYSYSWVGGPSAAINVVNEPAGTYNYTLSSTDANNCLTSKTVSLTFISLPMVTAGNVFICPLQTGTLNAFGASSYTWSNNTTGNLFTDNPLNTTQYSVIGSAQGCTALATASIILKSIPVPILTTNSPRCAGTNLALSGSGGVSYLWSGPSGFNSLLQNPVINNVGLATSGVYYLTITAANNCTAATNASVLVNPLPPLAASGVTVCTGQTLNLGANSIAGATYLWSGPMGFSSNLQTPCIVSTSLNHAGAYTVTATTVDGCINAAIALVNVVIPPNLNVTLSSNSVCAQALNGSHNTIILYAGGALTYTLSIPPHINNSNPSGPISQLSLLPPYHPVGAATATLYGANSGCTTSTTAVFTIVPNPTVSILSSTPLICAGQSLTFTSSGASSYTWQSANPGNTFFASSNIAVANPGINSVFSVIGWSLGCNSATQSTSVIVNPVPVFQITGNPKICLGSKALLTATGMGAVYSWNPPLYLNTSYGGTVLASPPGNQTYIVTSTLNNCTTSAAITVSVLPVPLALIDLSKAEVCLNETVTLKGSGADGYQWAGPGSFYSSLQSVDLFLNNLSYSGIYTLTVTDFNGCQGLATATIMVNDLPGAVLSGLQEGCAPFCPRLQLQTKPSVTGNWLYSHHIITGSAFSYYFPHPGVYKVYGNLFDSITACSNTLSYEIRVNPKPKADFHFFPELPTEGLDEVVFTDQSEGQNLKQWQWIFINNNGYKASKQNTKYLFNEYGTFPIAMTVKNGWGCADSVIKTITIEPDFMVFVPNTFTPNGDNLNDVFLAKGRGIASIYLQVFDRWGSMVFESTDTDAGWNGTIKGEEVQIGTYIWKLLVKNPAGKSKVLTGHLNLIR